MRIFPRLSYALFLFFATVDLTAAIPYPSEKDKWVKVTAGDFHIYSNASERETRELAVNLVRMREAIGKITRLNVKSPVPTWVVLFRNEKSFAPYRDAIFQRRDAAVTGGFVGASDGNFVFLQQDAEAGVDRVIYHELTHYFVDNTLSGVPLWFNEGLAEYYSTFSASGDSVLIGRPVQEHVHWLRDGHVMPLEQLFSVDTRSPDYSEKNRAGVFYAQSWALVHYLIVGNEERRPQLPVYLSLIAEGRPADEAFRTAFKTTYADLEKELRSYLRKPTMKYIGYSLSELAIPETPQPVPAARDEVLYALGNLLGHGNASTLGDAVAYLREAARVNPSNAEAQAALGFVLGRMNDVPAATAAFDKAVSLGSTDANVYIAYGSAILERLSRGASGPGGANTADVKRARELFSKATQLSPESARAHAGLGGTYLLGEGDVTPGIAALERSLALAASQTDVAINLIQLYAEAGRRDDAKRVFDAVLAHARDPEHVRQGREAVLVADVRAAEIMMSKGNAAEALPLLRAAAASTTNPRLKAHLDKVIASAGENETRRRQYDSAEQALEKARSGKYAEALAIVDELLAQDTDAQLREQLTKIRAELAKAGGKK